MLHSASALLADGLISGHTTELKTYIAAESPASAIGGEARL